MTIHLKWTDIGISVWFQKSREYFKIKQNYVICSRKASDIMMSDTRYIAHFTSLHHFIHLNVSKSTAACNK